MSTKRMHACIEILKFNIGGKRYEVSRDMLETNHQNTMLAKISSERWNQDNNDEIFIERDGDIFAFVLSYLRDGKAYLPM